MKQDSHEAKKLAALLKKLGSSYRPETPPTRDPVTQMIVGFLQWEATSEQAEDALGRLMAVMVDVNDLRVSLDHEILQILGEDYPMSAERVARLRESLNEVYQREYAVEMRSIASKGKKEQRAYLDSLPGMTPYVAASVTLLSFGGHAMPVDRKLALMLAQEEVTAPGTTPQELESQLLRMVKADDALQTHLLLQAWADDHETPPEALTPSSTGAAVLATPARRTAKKAPQKTTKRTTRRVKKK